MKIEINGDAFRLLEHFICYATGKHYKNLARAMFYDEDGFLIRAHLLDRAVHMAKQDIWEEGGRNNVCIQTY